MPSPLPELLPGHLRVPPQASHLRVELARATRSLVDEPSSLERFQAALEEPLCASEMGDPAVAAQMLGQAIALWNESTMAPASERAIRALLGAGARPDLAVELPWHWRLGSGGRASPARPETLLQPATATLMPLELFLAGHYAGTDEDDFFFQALPESLTRAVFESVDFRQAAVLRAIDYFLSNPRPPPDFTPMARWLQVQATQARLDTRLPQAASPRVPGRL